MSALSLRLEAILGLLQPCRLLADVGTDHGLVPAQAVLRGLAERALACDSREDPLRGARRTMAQSGVGDRVTVLRGDGLLPLEGLEVDALVLAGMSGELMERICSATPAVVGGLARLVTQPNTNAQRMRAWARAAGFHLTGERMVEERGRFFVVCAFERRTGSDPAYEGGGMTVHDLYRLGPLLLGRRDMVALEYYRAQRARLSGFVATGRLERRAELASFEAACALFDA